MSRLLRVDPHCIIHTLYMRIAFIAYSNFYYDL